MSFCSNISRPATWRWPLAVALWVFSGLPPLACGQPPQDYQRAQAVLTRYCAGCHGTEEANGGFRADSFAALMAGDAKGPVVTPGAAASSRLMTLMRGQREPVMPPEGEPAPTAEELEQVAQWIEAGAGGPDGARAELPHLAIPQLPTAVRQFPLTALALSPAGDWLAEGRFGQVAVRRPGEPQPLWQLTDLPGKVNALAFSPDGQRLMIGTGLAGQFGEVVVVDARAGQILARRRGHRDAVYAVAFSPDGSRWLSAGYDRQLLLWQSDQEEAVQVCRGHHDAIYAAGFDATGQRVFSASADATIKIWDVATGQRLDTRGEPLEGQRAAVLGPAGRFLYAAGGDHRIRQWQLAGPSPTAPLTRSRFAHEATIENLQLHPEGKFLVSLAADGELKFWALPELELRYRSQAPREGITSLAVARDSIWLATRAGTLERLDWPAAALTAAAGAAPSAPRAALPPNETATTLTVREDVEPNNLPGEAPRGEAPFEVTGRLEASATGPLEQDLFRFSARQGETWIVSARAGEITREGKSVRSPIDTRITILDAEGQPVPRVRLQAVRDSYFTFRGKDSSQTGDFRLHRWEEMQLGQLLYCQGEVVRLYHYPRGPDSGFNVFPNFGRRQGLFDTTSLAHALHEPCYIVEPHPVDAELPPTGLPSFVIPFENDDDAEREWGSDSRLTFEVPANGDYLVRVEDARGFTGPEYVYQLQVRPPQPSFEIRNVIGGALKLEPGGYRKLGVEIDRQDGFDGPVELELRRLPEGVSVAGPVQVLPGALRAWMVVHAEAGIQLSEETALPQLIARARIGKDTVERQRELAGLTVGEPGKLGVAVQGAGPTAESVAGGATEGLPRLVLAAGGIVRAQVSIDRRDFGGRVNFGKEDALINQPFGVYVANIGLNGVLIPPEENSRTFEIRCEPFVPPGRHIVFLEAEEAGRPASNPLILEIVESP